MSPSINDRGYPPRSCLIGVRGVGKSTLIRALLPQLPHLDYVVGSAILRELAGDDFARFDHLPAARKEHLRREAIAVMEERQRRSGRPLVCDGHTALLDESTGRVGPVFTERDCRFFDALLLLELPAEEVLTRRRADPHKRRSLDLAVIRAEIAGEREESARLARTYGMALHLLPTGEDAARRRLLELLAP